jgi:hypothetical protein
VRDIGKPSLHCDFGDPAFAVVRVARQSECLLELFFGAFQLHKLVCDAGHRRGRRFGVPKKGSVGSLLAVIFGTAYQDRAAL